MNGKGDKQRVRWSKDFAKRFNLIFNNKEKKTHGRHDNNLPKSNKEEIVDGINKKVNIPLVSEAKEEEIFDSLFDAVMEVLEAVLSKKK